MEKPLVGFPHGRVQVMLGAWFHGHHKEWGIQAAVETRTQISKGRVRLLDLVIVSKEERAPGALTSAPLIAMEVLSPTDTYHELKGCAADLEAMGTSSLAD